MFKIVEKKLLAENIYRLRVEAPRVAHSALPGQFVIVRTDEHGERVPLTIADYDPSAGTVTIVIGHRHVDAQDVRPERGRRFGRSGGAVG